MFKLGLLTLFVVILLALNRRLGSRANAGRIGYWAISSLGIAVFLLSLHGIHVSLSIYLTQFVKPVLTLLFGGA